MFTVTEYKMRLDWRDHIEAGEPKDFIASIRHQILEVEASGIGDCTLYSCVGTPPTDIPDYMTLFGVMTYEVATEEEIPRRAPEPLTVRFDGSEEDIQAFIQLYTYLNRVAK